MKIKKLFKKFKKVNIMEWQAKIRINNRNFYFK